MTPAERVLAYFDRISEAPDAIPRLRRFVLDLAVRGSLVVQKPQDEPASEQLKRIEVVRSARPQAARPAANSQASTHITTRDNLPLGWIRASLSDLLLVLNGRAYKQQELLSAGTPVLRVGNLFTSDKWYFSDLKLDDDKYCDTGDLIFAWSASFGPFIWRGGRVIFHYHIWKLRLHDEREVNKLYLYYFLQQKTREIKEAGHGVSMIHMTKQKMESLDIMVPPLAEQHRIVAKVDELMTLCDRLEAAQKERESRRSRLVSASLARLKVSNTIAGRPDAEFVLEQLSCVLAGTAQVSELRHALLDLAVRGALVPQSTVDASVNKLLESVESRRASLGLGTDGASGDALPLPFEIPSGWACTEIGRICTKTGSGSTPRGGKNAYKSQGIPFLRSQNVHNDGLRLGDVAYIDSQTHEKMAGTAVKAHDLLLNITGGSIGRCCIVPDGLGEANVSQHVAIIRPALSDLSPFLHLLILSPYFQALVLGEQTGAGRGGLPKNRMDRIPVVLPPLAEQGRIVTKIAELMRICDHLDAQLEAGRAAQAALLEATLREALVDHPVEAAVS